jgi:hypothetical protein
MLFKLGEDRMKEQSNWYKNKGIKFIFLGRKNKLPQ